MAASHSAEPPRGALLIERHEAERRRDAVRAAMDRLIGARAILGAAIAREDNVIDQDICYGLHWLVRDCIADAQRHPYLPQDKRAAFYEPMHGAAAVLDMARSNDEPQGLPAGAMALLLNTLGEVYGLLDELDQFLQPFGDATAGDAPEPPSAQTARGH